MTVRNAAFARAVRSAWDNICAACGARLVVWDSGQTLVDAAHLIPRSEGGSDAPSNGIALCKNHHWAMDSFLIAPGRDLKWLASRILDDRHQTERDLIALTGRPVASRPKDERLQPATDSLRWREEHLAQQAAGAASTAERHSISGQR